jgi:AbrB family looped-hinge helix DNA binding protein
VRAHVSELEVRPMRPLSSKVTTKGQVAIPKRLREKYGISPATAIWWIEKQEGILMVPETEAPIIGTPGMMKDSGILRAYLKVRDFEKQRENKKVGKSR